jgi:hypothetical protein
MFSETVREAIELCDSRLRAKGYTTTLLTDFSMARFDHIPTGAYMKLSDGNCGCSAIDIEISPVTERILNLTSYQFKPMRHDEIIYAVDHSRGANKIVRCWMHPGKMRVVIAPHQTQDVTAIVSRILGAM